ncbi:fatty-acid amide hydrolase 1-like [Nothoprocta perdicaria]|uniref:fatty-acid amide hydrolase 1-like n=1 Tax=Nothoprocta perdicaria TaxID=30464 RepID=UPI000E1C122F|nr:fatty-acid amide hydrolase 1-like [Nothoprocta perdicaria]
MARLHLPSLPTLLCCSAASLLLLLRWQWRRRLWKKVKEVQLKHERGVAQMEKIWLGFRKKHPSVDPVSILSLSLPELTRKLRNGSLPPEYVFCAYVGKALQITRETNCITEYMWESETKFQQAVRPEKPGLLFGVPVSIKDSINCQGYDSTIGFASNINKPAAEDSVLVQVLKRQGAIPFVKTNVPQSLISYDCNNVIFGQTLNPTLYTRTSGGSSGGEGALIGGGGSILGFGTDLGGSLRLPAAFCGICALKPTGNRLSKRGTISGIPGQKSVVAAVGPMAKKVETLALAMRALLCEDMFNLDSTVPPLPFNEEVYSSTKPLRIGYYETDFFTMPSPSMRRAVREMKQLLEDAGHTLVPFELDNINYYIFNLCVRGLFADGGSSFCKKFKGELVQGNMGLLLWMARTPDWLKTVLSWITKPFMPRFSSMLRNSRVNTVEDLWSLHYEIEESCHKFIAQWKKLNLDVMLCPVLGPALPVGYPGKLAVATSYTILYNCLDFPAGVVPVTTVTDEDEDEMENYKGHYGDHWDRILAKGFSGSVGLPVAVQCVALPWQEELCLRFMREVEKLAEEKNRIV